MDMDMDTVDMGTLEDMDMEDMVAMDTDTVPEDTSVSIIARDMAEDMVDIDMVVDLTKELFMLWLKYMLWTLKYKNEQNFCSID